MADGRVMVEIRGETQAVVNFAVQESGDFGQRAVIR